MNIIGSNGWERNDLEALIDMTVKGDLVPVVDRTVPLAEARDAFRLLDDRKVFGKVAIIP